MEKIPMTAAGYTVLETELKHRQQVERPRIIQQITDARSHGDLSENAEYHAAKESQSLNEGRIAELEDKLARAEVIDVSKLSGDTIKFGATVTLIDEDTDKKQVWQIVGEPEADAKKGRISITSPLARALIGKAKGASVEVVTPGGARLRGEEDRVAVSSVDCHPGRADARARDPFLISAVRYGSRIAACGGFRDDSYCVPCASPAAPSRPSFELRKTSDVFTLRTAGAAVSSATEGLKRRKVRRDAFQDEVDLADSIQHSRTIGCARTNASNAARSASAWLARCTMANTVTSSRVASRRAARDSP
jgi:transcription elongation factor GreA